MRGEEGNEPVAVDETQRTSNPRVASTLVSFSASSFGLSNPYNSSVSYAIMENGKGTELADQKPRTRYTSTKNRIPRSGQFQEQEYHSFPHWEKKFCTSICRIPWKKICETQKITYLYPKIDKWDDSGAKEAFDKGKARYWAEINDLPCDIPWPSTDEYIDLIDHDAIVDPALLEDLYKVPETISEEKSNNQATDEYVNIKPTGWGDEVIKSEYNNGAVIQNQPTGWGYENEQAPELNNGYQFQEEQSNQWFERKNPSNKINSADNYGCFKVNRDYNYNKKEFGSKRCKGRKNVNWKAQRESSWQWQKSVINNDETGGGSNICWDSYQPAVATAPCTGWGYEETYDNQAMYTDIIIPTGWGDDDIVQNQCNNEAVIQNQPTGWGYEDEQAPELNNVNQFPGWGDDDIVQNQCNNEAVIQYQPTGWGYEDEQAPELNNVNQFPEEQFNEWIERKSSSKKTNSTDKYGGFQVNSDYDYSKKEFGSKKGKGRKKAFYAINPSVNWKTQRESSWQWQKIVF